MAEAPDYYAQTPNAVTGHFTQVVWRSTTQVVCAAATCAPGTVRLTSRSGSDRAGCLEQIKGLLRSILRLPVQPARQLRRPVRCASAAAARISVYHLVGRASVDHIRAPDYHLDASYDHVYASHHDDAAQASPDGQPSSRARLITPRVANAVQPTVSVHTFIVTAEQTARHAMPDARRAIHLNCTDEMSATDPVPPPTQISSLSWRVRTSLVSSADST